MFYEQLIHMKVFCAAFMCLQFALVIFWQKDFGAKAAHKMLVKMTPSLLESIKGCSLTEISTLMLYSIRGSY
jgi:hypothetical protein